MKVLAAALVGLCLFTGPAMAQAPRQGPPPIVSPEVLADGRVAFRLLAPEATSVSVTGDWPGGIESTTTPMVKDDKGVWSATVGPLTPEFWIYTFTVNGVTTLDPRNINTRRNTTRIENTLLIPGPASADYMPQLDARANERLRLLFISIGTADTLQETHRVVKQVLKDKGLTYTLVEYPGYIHEWPVWRVTLKDVLPRLFQPASK